MRRYSRSWDEARIVKGEGAKECDVQQNEKYILLHIASSKVLAFHETGFEGIEYEVYIILLHIAFPNNITFHWDILRHLIKDWQIQEDPGHLRFIHIVFSHAGFRLNFYSAYQEQKYRIGVSIT